MKRFDGRSRPILKGITYSPHGGPTLDAILDLAKKHDVTPQQVLTQVFRNIKAMQVREAQETDKEQCRMLELELHRTNL